MAQVHEFELFDKFLCQLVSTIKEPEKPNGPGRPRLNLRDQIFCSVMKVYSLQPSRTAKHLYNDALERKALTGLCF